MKVNALCVARGPLAALQAYPRIDVEDPAMDGHTRMLARTFLELQGQDHALAEVVNDLLLKMEQKFMDLFVSGQDAGDIVAQPSV